MKAYTFVHSYICGIQVGIQAGHSNVELMRGLDPAGSECDELIDRWASDHKTFVWLDGGDSARLNDIINIIEASGCPYAYFNEPALKCSAADKDDAGMVTAVTVLLDTKLVEAADYIRCEGLHLNGTSLHNRYGDFDRISINLSNEERLLLSLIANSRSKSL